MPVSHRRAPRVARSPTVYTNAPNRRREPRSSHLCTLLRSHGATRDTTVYINAPIRRREAQSSHLCTLLPPRGAARDATVYTNTPIRRGEAQSSHLCTLLRSHGVARSPTVYTNAPIRRGEARSAHLCTLLRSQGHPQPSPQPNSVHKRPNPARRGLIFPSVYTPAVPCSPRKPTGILVEHVFKLEDLVIVEAPSQMVTINGVGATADVTLGNNFSALALGKHVPVFSDCSVRSAR